MSSDRYSRQSEHIPEGIRDKNICIIGVGGIGTWIATQCVMIGFKKLYLFDFDRIEIHNLNRQIFNEKDLGKSKALMTAEFLKNINSEIEIYAQNIKIVSKEQLPKDIDIILSSVDNLKTLKVLEEYVHKNPKVVLIDGKTMAEKPTIGTIVMIYKNKDKYGEHGKIKRNTSFNDYYFDFKKKIQEEQNTPSCGVNPSPAIVPTCICVSGLMMSILLNYLKDERYLETMLQINLGKKPDIIYFDSVTSKKEE